MHYYDPEIQNRINHLFANMPVSSRVSMAHTVGEDYKSKKEEGDDLLLVRHLFKFLLNDVESDVRSAISEQVRDYSELPKEWALQLAMDVESVALPILESSHVLENEHLIEILKSQNETKQVTIARRENLASIVTDCISEIGCLESVKECLKNQSAEISEYGYDQIIIRYKNEETIHQLIVRRPTLPDRIIRRMIQLVSEEMKNLLLQKGRIPESTMAKMVENAKEQALMRQLKKHTTTQDKKKAAAQLKREGKLTATLMLRSLIHGDIIFFTAGLSQTTDISIEKVASLILDHGFTGFNRLYENASLPPYLYPAFKAALEELQTKDTQNIKNMSEENQQNIIDKIAIIYNLKECLEIDSLMEKLFPDSL